MFFRVTWFEISTVFPLNDVLEDDLSAHMETNVKERKTDIAALLMVYCLPICLIVVNFLLSIDICNY